MDAYGNRTMSLRPNLESLAEVSEHHNYDMRRETLNVNNEIPNSEKFDALIDNVLTSFSEVQLSVQELMQLKDDLLMYYLPAPLLFRIAVVFGKVFRNFSDLNTPVTEMLRLVKIFSASWEKNGAILKKLNDMYENKKQLLNIAIKRLSAVEKKTKLFTREKRIQNWEKLFIKLSEAKGHGRRWKFQIETFRKKASMGYDELIKWIQNDSNDIKEENQNQQDEKEDHLKIDRKRMKSASKKRNRYNTEINLNDDDFDFNKNDNSIDEIDSDKDLFSDDDMDDSKNKKQNGMSENNKELVDINIQTEPYVDHQATWTGEPNYSRYMIVRVFKPNEYMLKKLKIKIRFNSATFTSVFDLPKADKKKSEQKDGKKSKDKKLLNSKQLEPLDDIKEEDNSDKKISITKYQDFLFEISDFIQKNTTSLTTSVNNTENSIYIEMNSDDKDHIAGYSNVQLDDIHTLDLPILYYKTYSEAEIVDYYDNNTNKSIQNNKETIKNDDASNWLRLNDFTSESTELYNMLSKRAPFNFDMYAMNKAKSGNDPLCKLPLMFFWIRKPSILTKDKNTGTKTINDLFNEMIQLNNLVPKKEKENEIDTEKPQQPILPLPPQALHPSLPQKQEVKKFDKICSPIKELLSRPPSSPIGSTTKSNMGIDDVNAAEIELIKENYEINIEQLKLRIMNLENELNTLKNLHELNMENQQNNLKIKSKIAKNSITSETKDNLKAAQRISNKQNQTYTRDIPQDFFDRLKLFNERSSIHHKEIIEKYLSEEANIREQQMAVQHRLDYSSDNQNGRLEDFCLPAVFMPFRASNNVFNPRAHQYFHPMGSNDPRLTQPPSVFQLPPLPSKTSLSVINLFEMGKRYQAGEVDFYLNNPGNKLASTNNNNNNKNIDDNENFDSKK